MVQVATITELYCCKYDVIYQNSGNCEVVRQKLHQLAKLMYMFLFHYAWKANEYIGLIWLIMNFHTQINIPKYMMWYNSCTFLPCTLAVYLLTVYLDETVATILKTDCILSCPSKVGASSSLNLEGIRRQTISFF